MGGKSGDWGEAKLTVFRSPAAEGLGDSVGTVGSSVAGGRGRPAAAEEVKLWGGERTRQESEQAEETTLGTDTGAVFER